LDGEPGSGKHGLQADVQPFLATLNIANIYYKCGQLQNL
jgi:hypothetical protein